MSYSIYPINNPFSNLPVYVFGLGYEDNQPHVFRKDGFVFPQIFICLSGEGILKIYDTEFIIKEGAFYILTANTPHEYYGTTDRWEVEWIAFTGVQADNILKELKLERTLITILDDLDKIEDMFQKAAASIKADDNTGFAVSSGILYEIIIYLFSEIYQKNKDDTSDEDRRINIIKLYINNHYNQDITLDVLSELADITPQYLCRLFKKYYNVRPFQYITMKRIQHAKILLSDNTLSVNEIAHSVGFNDCSYFCAIFKKYVMMSPTEFRDEILRRK